MTNTAENNTGRTRERSRTALVLALVLCGLLAACGSRRTHEELLADARAVAGSTGTEATGLGSAAAGDATVGGDDTGPDDGVPEIAGGGQPVAGGETGAAGADGGGTNTGGQDGGDQQASAGDAGPQCTGNEKPIRIGTVGAQSGVIGGFIRTGPLAVKAWVSKINRQGGVNCHPVEYTIADDGGDPARNQALTRRLVEQEGVIAIVHANAVLSGQASVGYLTKNGIPVIGNEGGSDWFYDSPVYRPQMSSGRVAARSALGTAQYLGKPKGLTKIGTIVCVEASFCTVAAEVAAKSSADFGLKNVFAYQGSLVQPDFTSVCQRADNAGAEILIVFMDPNAVSRIRSNCNSVGYKPIIETGGPLAGEGLLSDPSLEGTWLASMFLLPSVSNNSTVTEFQQAMAQFAPGVKADGAAFSGWLSARMFEEAAKKAGDDLTSEGILRGLDALDGNDLGAATMPLDFTFGENAPRKLCYFPGIVQDGKAVAVDNGARICE